MIGALVEVAGERGVGQVTVAHIVARSGVSRRTFYDLFEDREDCFLAAFDEAVERAAGRVLPAFRSAGGWRERVRAGLGALLEFLDDEPGLGALCVVDALGAGPRALERRGQVLELLIDAVDGGRGATRHGQARGGEVRRSERGGLRVERLTAEGVVGAVLAVLHARLLEGRPRSLAGGVDGARAGGTGVGVPDCGPRTTRRTAGRPDRPMVGLLGPLMGMIVLPYLGPAAASREVSRPAPRRRRMALPKRDPLRDLEMRLTYRTVRVLLAIAECPGASNRQVADASGVQDQGQISKLLARLEHLGLIHNDGAGPTRGEPNAWLLTPRGQEIEQTVGPQAAPGER
jgi:AcrR family transcriptional regulator/DNA-binding MarR family transcriptional regulator